MVKKKVIILTQKEQTIQLIEKEIKIANRICGGFREIKLLEKLKSKIEREVS